MVNRVVAQKFDSLTLIEVKTSCQHFRAVFDTFDCLANLLVVESAKLFLAFSRFLHPLAVQLVTPHRVEFPANSPQSTIFLQFATKFRCQSIVSRGRNLKLAFVKVFAVGLF